MDDSQIDQAAFAKAADVEAYAGAARAFDSYQVALEVFAEDDAQSRDGGHESA